jgi:hypothetical protein
MILPGKAASDLLLIPFRHLSGSDVGSDFTRETAGSLTCGDLGFSSAETMSAGAKEEHKSDKASQKRFQERKISLSTTTNGACGVTPTGMTTRLYNSILSIASL